MKATEGMVVSMHYTLTDDGGAVIDTSRNGEPFEYLHGHGNIVPGLEHALEGSEAGRQTSVTVAPEDGYGEHHAQAVFQVPRNQFPPGEEINVGMRVHGEGPDGVMAFTVAAASADSVTLDANHPLAGKTLHFEVDVLSVRVATVQEISHGHVHSDGADH